MGMPSAAGWVVALAVSALTTLLGLRYDRRPKKREPPS
jgi:hypothetical protein